MPRFKIVPADHSGPIEITSSDVAAALHLMSRRRFEQADIVQDDAYLFSARLSGGGYWAIFQRDDPERSQERASVPGEGKGVLPATITFGVDK